MRVEPALCAFVLFAAGGLAPCCAQQIRVSDAFPLRGVPQSVTVADAEGRPVAAAAVTVTYRPNSRTARRRELAPTDAAGRSEWTPENAGIVTLEATARDGTPLAEVNVAVRFGGMPPSGLAVIVIAGGLLFGGAALGFVLLTRASARITEREPPSM